MSSLQIRQIEIQALLVQVLNLLSEVTKSRSLRFCLVIFPLRYSVVTVKQCGWQWNDHARRFCSHQSCRSVFHFYQTFATIMSLSHWSVNQRKLSPVFRWKDCSSHKRWNNLPHWETWRLISPLRILSPGNPPSLSCCWTCRCKSRYTCHCHCPQSHKICSQHWCLCSYQDQKTLTSVTRQEWLCHRWKLHHVLSSRNMWSVFWSHCVSHWPSDCTFLLVLFSGVCFPGFGWLWWFAGNFLKKGTQSNFSLWQNWWWNRLVRRFGGCLSDWVDTTLWMERQKIYEAINYLI